MTRPGDGDPWRFMPIFLMRSEGVTQREGEAVREGVQAVLEAAGTADVIGIEDAWQAREHFAHSRPVDEYVRKARTHKSCGYGAQLDAKSILHMFMADWIRVQSKNKSIGRRKVMVLDSDLVVDGVRFLVGLALPHGAVLSVVRFRELRDENMRHACIATEAMHELGHVFQAAQGRRGVDALGGQGNSPLLYDNHCANECVMRQGNLVPDAWVKMTEDRLKSGRPFCPQCTEDMRAYCRAQPA